MFNKPLNSCEKLLHVRVVSSDAELATRVKTVLEGSAPCHVEACGLPLFRAKQEQRLAQHTSILVVELTGDRRDLSALQDIAGSHESSPSIIVIANDLGEETARTLLKLRVSDWLKKACTDDEILRAYSGAIARSDRLPEMRANCTAFKSVVGGAGASTLALALLDSLIAANKSSAAQTCVVDLNFQTGIVADYLDVEPAFNLAEITPDPRRLDKKLLDVMLTRHSKGFSVLAAPTSLFDSHSVKPELIGHLLDTLASQFKNIIVDMPAMWPPWCESLVRGCDQLFLVTNMTAMGTRQARRVADQIADAYGVDMKASVIVNRSHWRSFAGIKKRDVKAALGQYLAGFIAEAGELAAEAQNRGIMFSDLKRKHPISEAMRTLIRARS